MVDMKGLRPIVILGVIALFAAGWYSLFNNSEIKEQEYLECLNLARNKAQMGIYTDANEIYKKALKMNENIDLRSEIADYYLNSGQTDAFLEECTNLISQYPKKEIGYSKLLEYFYENEAYSECYTVIDKANKRKIKSKKINEIWKDIYYTYNVKGFNIGDIGILSGGFFSIMDEKGNWGYYSEAGFTAIGSNYRQTAPFTSDGYACVYNEEGSFYLINSRNEKKYVDIEKKKIDECLALSGGIMAAKINGRYTYLNINFQKLFGDYEYAGTFNEGLAAVKDNEGWFIINTNNEKLMNTKYADIKLDSVKMAFRNSLAFVSEDGKQYYLINSAGKKVGSQTWDDSLTFLSADPTAVLKDGKWGFVDTSGKVVIEPKYEEARPFFNGFAAVKVDGKWGYINSSNYELVIPAEYEQVSEMTKYGNSFVMNQGKWYVLSLYRYNH